MGIIKGKLNSSGFGGQILSLFKYLREKVREILISLILYLGISIYIFPEKTLSQKEFILKNLKHHISLIKDAYIPYSSTITSKKNLGLLKEWRYRRGMWFPVSKHPQKTKIVYENIKINQGIKDEEFEIEFPPGTEVIDHITGEIFTWPEKWTKNPNEAEFIKKRLEYSINLIQTAECNYIVEREVDRKYVKKYKVDWKYKNNKEFLNAEYLDNDGKVYQHMEYFFDGENTTVIVYKNRKIEASIVEGLNPTIYVLNPPSSFLFHLWPGISIKKILSADNIEIQKKEIIKNEECYPIVYKEKPFNSFIYKLWLSPSKNFLPVKIEIIIKNEKSIVAEIDYELKNNVFFPVKVLGYTKDKGKAGPYTKIIYQNIKINSGIDDKFFIPIFKPGTVVYDGRKGSSFTVPKK